MPWGQGGFGGSSATDYLIQFNGGFALVNVENGDHDGYDSNGCIEVNGGYVVTNGNEPFDCGDSSGCTLTCNGGVWISNCPAGGMMMGGAELPASATVSRTVYADTRVSLVDGSDNVILSFIVDKTVKNFRAGGSGVTSGASFKSGGTLSGSTYFQQEDQTQLAAFGGKLSGGTTITP